MTEDDIIKANAEHVERLFMRRRPGWSGTIEDVWRLGLVNGAAMVLSGAITTPERASAEFATKQQAALLALIKKR